MVCAARRIVSGIGVTPAPAFAPSLDAELCHTER
jgi:hypothetical protein